MPLYIRIDTSLYPCMTICAHGLACLLVELQRNEYEVIYIIKLLQGFTLSLSIRKDGKILQCWYLISSSCVNQIFSFPFEHVQLEICNFVEQQVVQGQSHGNHVSKNRCSQAQWPEGCNHLTFWSNLPPGKPQSYTTPQLEKNMAQWTLARSVECNFDL